MFVGKKNVSQNTLSQVFFKGFCWNENNLKPCWNYILFSVLPLFCLFPP